MTVWDVRQVAPRDQFGYWREVICEAFVPLVPTATHDRREFASLVEVRPVGGLNCAVISSRSQRTAHGPAEVRRTPGAYYFVNLQLAGTCAVRQGDRDGVVQAGQFTVLDTTEPYYLEFPADWRMVSFRVPHGELGPRLRQRTGGTGVAVDSRSGAGRVVSGLMRSLWQLGATDGIGAAAASGQWAQSFAAAVAGAVLDQVPEAAETDLRQVIERYVHANLAGRDLSVRAVAARFGISPRSLHTLFSGADQSFGGMVRRARLQRCAEVLADPSCGWTVGEVGVRHGFGDPTAFGRAFRREFGITPGEARRSGGARDGGLCSARTVD